MSHILSYSIIIPVYNSDETLYELAKRIHVVFTESISQSYEIIFVNDGSGNPKTKLMLAKIANEYTTVQIVELTRNFGQQAATLCGINHSKGNYIITMDDDLQHSPEEITKLVQLQNHDVVIANFPQSKHSLLKKAGSGIKAIADRLLLEKPKNLRLSGFRLFNRIIADNMLTIQTPYPYIPALIFYVTRDIVNVDVSHEERRTGKSGYSFSKQLKVVSNLLINNSSLLLKLIAGLGISISMLSFIVMISFIIKKIFFGIPIIGWTSIMVSTLGIGGIILFSLGILGEYLIRMIAGTEKRPTYIIRSHFTGKK